MSRGEIRIALTGAHRTGKTTLARDFAHCTGMEFRQVNASDTFKRLGYRADFTLGFRDRLFIQTELLKDFREVWSAPGAFITDRSPLCMAAYTLAEVQQDSAVNADDQKSLNDYIGTLLDVHGELFNVLVHVPIDIPIVNDGKSAACNWPFMFHIQVLVRGLGDMFVDSVDRVSIPAGVTNRQARVNRLAGAYSLPIKQPIDD